MSLCFAITNVFLPVIPDDADVQAHLGCLWSQGYLVKLQELDGRRVEVEEAEIVHGVTVDGLDGDFLSI